MEITNFIFQSHNVERLSMTEISARKGILDCVAKLSIDKNIIKDSVFKLAKSN